MSAVVVAALYFAQDVLIEITLAVLLSFVLAPLVNLLGRIGLWRAPAVALSILVALSVLGLLGMMLGSQAATLAADAPRYLLFDGYFFGGFAEQRAHGNFFP